MTDESTSGEGIRWLLEPPAPGEVRLYIAADAQAQLTPQVREALDRLVEALEAEDVQGFAARGCGSLCDLCRLETFAHSGFACVTNLSLRIPGSQAG